MPYYTSIVLPAIWPAFLVTGLAAAFLLTLILWRAVRRCVLLARPRQLTHVARLRKVRALHRVRVWGAAGALCAAGVLVGVVLAGPWGGPHIVPRTFEVVDGARVRRMCWWGCALGWGGMGEGRYPVPGVLMVEPELGQWNSLSTDSVSWV